MKALRAKLRGWRTLAFNAVLGSGSVILLFLDELKSIDLSEVVSAKVLPYITLGVSIAGLMLRIYTTHPVGRYRDEYEYPRDYDDYGQRRTSSDARPSRRKGRYPAEPELD